MATSGIVPAAPRGMKNPLSIAGAIVASAFMLTASPVAAQAQAPTGTTPQATTPRLEFSGGYQLFRVGQVCDSGALTQTCVPNRMFPLGFAVDGARNYGPWGLVAEGGWSKDSETGTDRDLAFNTWHLAGGARWTSRRHSVVWPYAQFLAGDVDASGTSFMLQPGFGAAVIVGRGWGVSGQIDYRRVFLDEEERLSNGRNDFRLFIGLRLMVD
jgi:hypothetical protein